MEKGPEGGVWNNNIKALRHFAWLEKMKGGQA
jgi:hypothetical protein